MESKETKEFPSGAHYTSAVLIEEIARLRADVAKAVSVLEDALHYCKCTHGLDKCTMPTKDGLCQVAITNAENFLKERIK